MKKDDRNDKGKFTDGNPGGPGIEMAKLRVIMKAAIAGNQAARKWLDERGINWMKN